MLKLESLLTFVTTAETSSISEAARRLQISKSVASERLAELERSIGATLMRRSTRKLMLTEDGLAFLERAKRIVREVTEATAEVSERRGELVGPMVGGAAGYDHAGQQWHHHAGLGPTRLGHCLTHDVRRPRMRDFRKTARARRRYVAGEPSTCCPSEL